MVRAGIFCGILGVALAGTGVALLRPPRPPQPAIANVQVPGGRAPRTDRARGRRSIERIETDPTIARRLAVSPAAPKWEQIDDDQLCRELAKAGLPAGLAKIDGKVTLLFHEHSR